MFTDEHFIRAGLAGREKLRTLTIAQLQRLLQDGLYGARELRFFSSHYQDFPTGILVQIENCTLKVCLYRLMREAYSF
jgi:hypothetical protein